MIENCTRAFFWGGGWGGGLDVLDWFLCFKYLCPYGSVLMMCDCDSIDLEYSIW